MFMALALPCLQAVLKTCFLRKAPLLNFMRALAYGLALAGVVLVTSFGGWVQSDESHGFKASVPALCAVMQQKKVRCWAARRVIVHNPCACNLPVLLRRVSSALNLHACRTQGALAPSPSGLLRRSRGPGASPWPASRSLSAARMKKPGVVPPRSCCLLRCALALVASHSLIPCRAHIYVAVLSCAHPHTHASQLLSSLLCSWVAAQIGPVQMRLADALQVFCGTGLASTGIIMCLVLGWEGVTNHPYLLNALSGKSGGAFCRAWLENAYRLRLTLCAA